MLGERYVVRGGDNLWNISKHHLGAGSQWPRIWRYNNRADVIRATGHGVPDPDLIHPGHVLLLPTLAGARSKPDKAGVPGQGNSHGGGHGGGHASPGSHAPHPGASGQPQRSPAGGGDLSRQLPSLHSPISIKFKLDDLRMPPLVQPGLIMEVRMTGEVVLMTKKSYPALYVTNRRELELQVTSQANQAFKMLTSDNRLIYDARDQRLTLRSMLVSQSTTPNVPTTAVGVQMDSHSPLPKLRFELRLPKLEGPSILDFKYVAMGVTLVVELTPTPLPPSGPSAQPQRVPHTDWARVIGTGLVVAAGVVVVGTLVEDFFTAGAGVADDPASFAVAGSSFARGMLMLRGAAAAAALPRAAVAAHVMMSFRLVPMMQPALAR